MFSHIFVGSNNLDTSKTFYDAVFGAIGGNAAHVDTDKNRLIYSHNGSFFMVCKPIDGAPATPANGGTIGFGVASPDAADAWHAAGVANGGTTCEDKPGERPGSGLYLAYLRDPDGNKLCALHPLAK